jgi:hypothetical protein
VIGFGAFVDCTQLHHIQLPYHLKRLEACMFANCPQLATITCVEYHNNNSNNKTVRNNGSTALKATSTVIEKSAISYSSYQHRSLLDDDDDDDDDDEDDDDEEGNNDVDQRHSSNTIQLPPKLLSIGTSSVPLQNIILTRTLTNKSILLSSIEIFPISDRRRSLSWMSEFGPSRAIAFHDHLTGQLRV